MMIPPTARWPGLVPGRWVRRRRGADGEVRDSDLLKCSFCGKSQKQVKKLIAGPGVYICDECIDLCNEIIEEELSETSELKLDELPKPQEIFAFLDEYVVDQDAARRCSRSPSTTTTSASRSARRDPTSSCRSRTL